MSTTWSPTPIIGAAWDVKTADAYLRVGTVVGPLLSDIAALNGKFAMYVKANGAIGNSAFVTVAMTSLNMLASSVASGTSSGLFRNGSVAFADGEFGWVYSTYTAIPVGTSPPLNPLP